MRKQVVFIWFVVQSVLGATEGGYRLLENQFYREGESTLTEYQKERCRLDIYYPGEKKDFATVVWFHGGGLTGGKKKIPKELEERGIAVVAVN